MRLLSAEDGVAVTPDDDDTFRNTSALWVGTGGDLTVQFKSGNVVTLPDVAVGYHPLQVNKVLATGTTASGIVALYF